MPLDAVSSRIPTKELPSSKNPLESTDKKIRKITALLYKLLELNNDKLQKIETKFGKKSVQYEAQLIFKKDVETEIYWHEFSNRIYNFIMSILIFLNIRSNYDSMCSRKNIESPKSIESAFSSKI